MNEEVSNNILILREYIKRYSPVETYIRGQHRSAPPPISSPISPTWPTLRLMKSTQ